MGTRLGGWEEREEFDTAHPGQSRCQECWQEIYEFMRTNAQRRGIEGIKPTWSPTCHQDPTDFYYQPSQSNVGSIEGGSPLDVRAE